MNIYFSCSITGGRNQENIYAAIVDFLLAKGHEVPTAHLASSDVFENEMDQDPTAVYKRDIEWVRGCDALIAEVSTPSHGVGYEIAAALYEKKPVLCCAMRGVRVSKMITGNHEYGFKMTIYRSIPGLLSTIEKFLSGYS